MVGKRKANAMMEQISKMAKQNNEEKEEQEKETKAAIGDGVKNGNKGRALRPSLEVFKQLRPSA